MLGVNSIQEFFSGFFWIIFLFCPLIAFQCQNAYPFDIIQIVEQSDYPLMVADRPLRVKQVRQLFA